MPEFGIQNEVFIEEIKNNEVFHEESKQSYNIQEDFNAEELMETNKAINLTNFRNTEHSSLHSSKKLEENIKVETHEKAIQCIEFLAPQSHIGLQTEEQERMTVQVQTVKEEKIQPIDAFTQTVAPSPIVEHVKSAELVKFEAGV